ncbi:hypothetical protein HYI18_03760 [Clostridium botulinum]|nr:hypothetical protein [Clostridium botulinum]
MKVARNKVAPIFKKAEFDIMYNGGVSKEGFFIGLSIIWGVSWL